jgi:hypothetical protein
MPDGPLPGDVVVAPHSAGHVVIRAGAIDRPVLAEQEVWPVDEAIAFATTRAQALGVDVWLNAGGGAYRRLAIGR